STAIVVPTHTTISSPTEVDTGYDTHEHQTTEIDQRAHGTNGRGNGQGIDQERKGDLADRSARERRAHRGREDLRRRCTGLLRRRRAGL
ncbi:MAG: hypothetical protein ACK53Y_11485, partial [bacterium]